MWDERKVSNTMYDRLQRDYVAGNEGKGMVIQLCFLVRHHSSSLILAGPGHLRAQVAHTLNTTTESLMRGI